MKDVDLFDYMNKARDRHEYGFKRTNGTQEVMYNSTETINRGMPIGESVSGLTVFASARDIGNMAAGLVAGNNGLPWSLIRLGCDAYQSYQTSMKEKSVVFEREGRTTQEAQRLGWLRSIQGTNSQFNGKRKRVR
jgi:hypothetical protein